ncbi:unnamed protein product [Trichogramma brassicae]|uniref:Uncharacterized protein n=1 Tax=Trichogramma brassicae TaxID=86971 RepID=A0A6H5HVX3_9HYME|nr:unnamed protein product [Trichogramma brassicae]
MNATYCPRQHTTAGAASRQEAQPPYRCRHGGLRERGTSRQDVRRCRGPRQRVARIRDTTQIFNCVSAEGSCSWRSCVSAVNSVLCPWRGCIAALERIVAREVLRRDEVIRELLEWKGAKRIHCTATFSVDCPTHPPRRTITSLDGSRGRGSWRTADGNGRAERIRGIEAEKIRS